MAFVPGVELTFPCPSRHFHVVPARSYVLLLHVQDDPRAGLGAHSGQNRGWETQRSSQTGAQVTQVSGISWLSLITRDA